MADDLSLLFKIRGDSAGAKTAVAETRAAVQQLRTALGSDFTSMQAASKNALAGIGDNLNVFVGQRIPLIGGSFVRVTQNLQSFGKESAAAEKATAKLNTSIEGLAKETGKTSGQITSFLTKFVQLETQAKRDTAAIETFGAAAAQKLIPQLEKTGAELATVASTGTATGISLGALANPVGIVVVALAALGAAALVASKQIFDLTKSTAGFQGKLFDLSQQTGLSVETLSALEVVATTTGGSLATITASLGIFQRKLEDAQDPLSKTAAKFRDLGVSGTDTESALRATLLAISQMPEGFEQTAAALELFGRGGKSLLAILKETNGDLDQTIARLRSLGVLIDSDTARAADEFNDTLAILQFQIRALTGELAKEAMPLVLAVIKDFSSALKDNKEAIQAVGIVIGGLALFLSTKFREGLSAANSAVIAISVTWKAFKDVLEEVAEAYERVRAVASLAAGIPLPALPSGRPDVGAEAEIALGQTEARRRGLLAELSVFQTLSEASKQLAEQRKRDAATQIAAADLAFKSGQSTRQEEFEAISAANREKLQADLDAIASERAKLETLQELYRNDSEKRQETVGKLRELETREAELRNADEIEFRRRRSEAKRAEQEDEVAHRRRLLEIAASGDKARIDLLKSQAAEGTKAIADANREIESIENTALDRRANLLARELELSGRGPKRQEILDQITALEVERTAVLQTQTERRTEIERRSAETQRQLILGNLETSLRLGEIRDAAVIASLRALAAVRLRTEEETEGAVLKVRLDALSREEEAIRARLTAAKSIRDPEERTRAEAELNNQLRILEAERTSIQFQGERDREEGRQRDLENERGYADEILGIRRRIQDTERETARTVIDLMVLNFARRKDIVRAQADLEIRQAEDRHQRNQEGIRRDQAEVTERLGILRGFLTSLELTGQRETNVYAERLRARVQALSQQAELNAQEIEELAQHQVILTALQGRSEVQDYQKAIEARVNALEQQKELNAAEQEELEQHQAILRSLRERDERIDRSGTLQARIDVLERQQSLNREEREELERHQAELKGIRATDDLGDVITRRVAYLTQQRTLNTQEQTELERHSAILKLIRAQANIDSYTKAIEARVDALQKQGQLNLQEQEELRQHQLILNALRGQAQRDARAIELQGLITALEGQRKLNEAERRELERHQVELKQLRARDADIGPSIQKRVEFLRAQVTLNADEQDELERHEAVLATLRARSSVQDYREVIRVRANALEQQKDLNAEEQKELAQHQSILEAFRERDKESLRAGTIQTRIDVLQQQKSLNREEQAELESHEAELRSIRDSVSVGDAIERRIAVLTQQRQLNAQEQVELKNHHAILALIRGSAGIVTYTKEIEARVNALRQQGVLNRQEQSELEQHQQILDAIRARTQGQARAIDLQARINDLRRQKELNTEEQKELESHQAELKSIRERDDLESSIERRVEFLSQQTVLNASEQEELRRHVAILQAIREGAGSLESTIRARIAFLESQKSLNAEEQEELRRHREVLDRLGDRSKSYEDAIRQRIAVLQKQKELNAEEAAELERHEAEIERIKAKRKKDEKEADPLEKIKIGMDDIKEFARVLEESVLSTANILTNAFFQVANAIGSVVSNWVLLGTTGPAVMRKILAQALASIAAEAAINAIKMAAVGFARLAMWDFAGAANAFVSAGLWAGIAGVSAIAGRGVAGDLFKKPETGSGAGTGSRDGVGQLNPLNLERTTQPRVVVTVNVKQDPHSIVDVFAEDFQSGGRTREIINNDGVFEG